MFLNSNRVYDRENSTDYDQTKFETVRRGIASQSFVYKKIERKINDFTFHLNCALKLKFVAFSRLSLISLIQTRRGTVRNSLDSISVSRGDRPDLSCSNKLP